MTGKTVSNVRAATTSVDGRHAAATAPDRAETWPGPAAPLAWLGVLAATGALIGVLVGALVGALAQDRVTVSTEIRVLPDAEALSGPLEQSPTVRDTDNFVAAEQSYLGFQQKVQEDALGSDVSITISQVGTSDVLRISASAMTADAARAAVTAMLDAYVERRQSSALGSLEAAIQAIEERLAVVGTPVIPSSPQAQESARLLSQQSDLEAAVARVPEIVPVLQEPAVEPRTGVSGALLSTMLGAVLGAVLLLALGTVWRATSSRLFDARLLVAAGVHVLLPRVPAGRIRRRSGSLPGSAPNAATRSAAALLLPQLFDVHAEPRVLLLVGTEPSSGAAEVTWALSCALADAGRSVAVLTDEADGGEREMAAGLRLVPVARDASDDLIVAEVERQRTAGRHVLLHAPAVSADGRLAAMMRQADGSVVVVGEGVSTVEASLAAVRDLAAAPTPLIGIVVTTSHPHGGSRVAGQRSPATATQPVSRPREPVSSEI